MKEFQGNQYYSRATILIRILVGGVFLSEGIQKILFPDTLGVGRFIKIGIPFPDVLAPFVGSVEIICGGLILLGMFTRFAAIPLIITISAAILTTKIPMLYEKGFWAMAHEARADWSMILGLFFLLIVGPGKWSLDHFRSGNKSNLHAQRAGSHSSPEHDS
jgi:putative oxidoreductase